MTPKPSTCHHTLAASALLNSARKAVEEANRLTAARSRFPSVGSVRNVNNNLQNTAGRDGETAKKRPGSKTLTRSDENEEVDLSLNVVSLIFEDTQIYTRGCIPIILSGIM